MALNKANLSVLTYANGFALWHYKSTDTAATIDTSGYFNGVSDMVRVGDMILANCDTAGTPSSGIFVVNANSSGVVDTANLTAFDSADSD